MKQATEGKPWKKQKCPPSVPEHGVYWEQDDKLGCFLFDIGCRSTWTEANQYCRSFGSQLAEVTSKEMLNFIKKFGKDNSDKDVQFSFTPNQTQENTDKKLARLSGPWLGGNDIDEEGTWIWETSKTPLDKSIFTERSEFNRTDGEQGWGGEDCLELFSNDGTVNDMNCELWALNPLCHVPVGGIVVGPVHKPEPPECSKGRAWWLKNAAQSEVTRSNNGICPPDLPGHSKWKFHEKLGCFLFDEKCKSSWSNAVEYCKELAPPHSKLVEVDSKEILDYIKIFGRPNVHRNVEDVDFQMEKFKKLEEPVRRPTETRPSGPWLGASDIKQEGEWVWETSRKPMDSSIFPSIFTDNTHPRVGGEDCLELFSSDGTANDMNCDFWRLNPLCHSPPMDPLPSTLEPIPFTDEEEYEG